MIVKNVSENFVVFTSDCDMWCAIVEKKSNGRWAVRLSHDGESHLFCVRSYFTKYVAIAQAEKFIEKYSK